VTYREAASLPDAVHALLAEPTQPISATAGRLIRESDGSSPFDPADTAPHRYFRAPYVDAVQLDEPDRLAILQSAERGRGGLHVLAGVAPAVWRGAEAASVSDLTAAAIAAYGQPDGDATAIVEAALDELVAAGLLSTDR
jgi:hypothetical protein